MKFTIPANYTLNEYTCTFCTRYIPFLISVAYTGTCRALCSELHVATDETNHDGCSRCVVLSSTPALSYIRTLCLFTHLHTRVVSTFQ